jgi:hypothetical protein
VVAHEPGAVLEERPDVFHHQHDVVVREGVHRRARVLVRSMAQTEFLPSAHRTKRQITPRGSWSTITTGLSSTEPRRARSQDTWRATRCVRQLNSGYEKADQRVIHQPSPELALCLFFVSRTPTSRRGLRPPRQRAQASRAARSGGRRPQTRPPSRRPRFAGPGYSHNRMTLATYTLAIEGTQDAATAALDEAIS